MVEKLGYTDADKREDVKVLHGMGYAQELSRRMSGFSNFAISFSIICILAGGITAFQIGFSAAGGASIGIGWPLGCAYSLIVACSMGQIASAYPTAGGLYRCSASPGGGVWPLGGSLVMVFLLGLLLPGYTVTGFDASAHTSEETRGAATNVPKGMIRSVFWSFLFGYIMICAFVLAMSDPAEGAKQG